MAQRVQKVLADTTRKVANIRNGRWQKAVTAMAALVVFVTTYMLILPALTLASVNPKLESERTQGALGDALTATVTAEVDNTQEEQVFLLRTVGDNAGLDESYAFDENDVTIITDNNQNEIELHRQPQQDGTVDYWFTLPAGESAKFPLTFSNGAAMPIIGTTEDEPADEATEMDTNDAEDTEVTVEETAATTENTDESTEETEVEPVSVTYVPGDKSIGGSLKFYACSAMTLEEARALLADLPEDQPATLDFVWDAQIESMENEQPEEEELAEEPKEETVTEEKQEEEKKTEEQDNTSITLTAKGDDYTVSVTYDSAANIPANAELTAKEYSADGKTFKQYQKKTETAILKELDEESITLSGMRLFDVEIRADGKKIEPEAPVDVHFDFDDAEGLDNNCTIVHFADAGTEVLMNQDVTAEVEKNHSASVDFTLDSFSMVSIVYTVDFHYEVDGKMYDFSIPGGGFVSFEKLMEVLGVVEKDVQGNSGDNSEEIQTENALTLDDLQVSEETKKFVADVEKVEFSSPELLSVSKVEENTTVGAIKDGLGLECEYSAELTEEDIAQINATVVEGGDWALISLKVFDTEETLTVTMKTGEVFTVKVTDFQLPVNAHDSSTAEGTLMSSDAYADVRGDGITIKLFDYSGSMTTSQYGQNIDTKWGNSTDEGTLRNGWGINNGRTLLFSGSGLKYDNTVSWYNQFRGSNAGGSYYSGVLVTGIVGDKLVGNYPVLSEETKGWQSKDVDDNGSLGYLFGAGGQDGVKTYTGAEGKGLTGLLQKSSDGYYYYTSEANYAQLDSTDPASATQIQLYSDTYKKADSTSGNTRAKTQGIGYFPFTEYDASKTEEKGPNTGGDYYDHQFGMTLSAKFVYPENGYLPDSNGNPDESKPMEFEFSGDDDVWVFVDGVLVLDLGGVHSPVRGNINFADGKVRIYPYNSQGTETEVLQLENFYDKIERVNGEAFDKTPYSEHQIDFFYVERGGCDSNCSLSFNLLTKTPDQKYGDLTFEKVDDSNVALDGASFKLFTDESCTTPVMFNDNGTIRMATATSADGKVRFSHIPTGNYYMQETSAPEGYAVSDRVYIVHIDEANGASTIKYHGEDIEKIVNHELKMTLKKVDDNGQPLTGAKFSLAYTSADGNETSTSAIEIASSNGQCVLNNLSPGSYVLAETEAPNGYTGLGNERIEFTVTESGIVLGDHPESVTYDGDALILTIPNEPEVDDDNIKVLKRWLDSEGNVVEGVNKTARVKIQRKKWSAGSEPETHNINVNLHFPAYSDWWFDEKTINLSGSGAGSTITLLFHFFGGNTNVQNGFTCSDSRVGITSSYPYSSSNDWNWVQVELTNVTQDITVNYTFSTNGGESAWVYNNEESIRKDFRCTGDGSGGTQPALIDDEAFNSSTDPSHFDTLSSPNWSKKWTIGDAAGYNFPATDGTNAYQYYIIEVDSNGNEISVGQKVDGVTLVGYSANNSTGVSNQGVITVYNEIDEVPADITIQKIDSNTSNALGGARFYLMNGKNAVTELNVISLASGNPAITLDSDHCFMVPEEGLKIQGLTTGTYKLVEKEAPAGYVITNDGWEFTVNADGTITGDEDIVDGLVMTIPNEPGVALPNTGGPGTTMYTIGGILLLSGAALYALRRRREQS